MMTKEERAAFVTSRLSYLGGSDTVHLVAQAPYGCRRRLLYEKVGLAPDFPFDGNHNTRRGEALEEFAAADFADRYRVDVMPVTLQRLARAPYIGCRPDRILAQGGDRSILSIKCPNWFNYRSIRASEEPPPDNALQLQWEFLVTGLRKGWIWYWSAEIWGGTRFEVVADHNLFGPLEYFASNFWTDLVAIKTEPGLLDALDRATFSLNYEKLPDGDVRCQTCPFRTRCKGLGAMPEEVGSQELIETAPRDFVVDHSMNNLVALNLQLRREKKEATAAFEETQDEIRRLLAGRNVRTAYADVWIHKSERKGYTVAPRVIETLKIKTLHELGEDEL